MTLLCSIGKIGLTKVEPPRPTPRSATALYIFLPYFWSFWLYRIYRVIFPSHTTMFSRLTTVADPGFTYEEGRPTRRRGGAHSQWLLFENLMSKRKNRDPLGGCTGSAPGSANEASVCMWMPALIRESSKFRSNPLTDNRFQYPHMNILTNSSFCLKRFGKFVKSW